MTEFNEQKWDEEVKAVELVLYEHQEMAVENQIQYNEASDFIKQAKMTIKIVETKRKQYTAPLDEMKSSIMARRNAIVKPLEEKIEQVDALMLAWIRKEQTRIAIEQAKLEADALAKAKLEHKSEVVVPVLEVAKKQSTGFSSTTVRKVWLHEVVDVTKIPAEFLLVNDVAIRAKLREGVRSIPGLRIYEDIDLSHR